MAWPFFGIWFLADGFRKRPRMIWGELLAYSLACLLPSLAIIGLYWSRGYLSELYKCTLWFDFEIYGKLAPVSLSRKISQMIYMGYSLLSNSPLVFVGATYFVLISAAAGGKLKKKIFLSSSSRS